MENNYVAALKLNDKSYVSIIKLRLKRICILNSIKFIQNERLDSNDHLICGFNINLVHLYSDEEVMRHKKGINKSIRSVINKEIDGKKNMNYIGEGIGLKVNWTDNHWITVHLMVKGN